MKRPKSRVAIISVLLLSVMIFVGVFYTWNTFTDILLKPADSTNKKDIAITIPKNATTADIANELYQKGLIHNVLAFRLWARLKGLDTKLQAGVYKGLSPSMTTDQIITVLLNGQPDAVPVTILEGWRLEQIANELDAQKAFIPKFDKAKFLNYTKNINQFPDKAKHPLLQEVPADLHTMEGLLFPDTYYIAVDATTEDIINTMLSEIEEKIHITDKNATTNLETVAKVHQYKNAYEMIIMASIVERETGNPKYRPGIASVYWNRIYRPNDETVGLLNADPTVQYARDTDNPPTKYWQALQGSGTQIEPNSLWNTYVQQGLTPTPICSPGLASLQAAAVPPASDNYFFFAATDGVTYFAPNQAKFEELQQEHPVNNG